MTSPEKRCGKSNLLILLQFLVPRPLPTSNVTSAALYRAVEFFHPCLLIDEGDSFLTDKEDLRGILNSGHNRALAIVIRTVGDDHEPRAFSTWSPKVIALIGQLSDTLVDRSIDVRMQRKLAHEYVERMPTHRELLETTEDLRRKLARWAQDNSDALESGDPEIPTELHDRARDNWRPLLSVADLVGGRWPSRAREAALHLSGLVEEDSSLAVLLLSDLRDHFRDNFPDDRFSSTDTCFWLSRMEERPWPEFRSKSEITPTQLASLLKPFGISPKSMRIGAGTARGYKRHWFDDAFARYLGTDPFYVPADPDEAAERSNSPGPDAKKEAER